MQMATGSVKKHPKLQALTESSSCSQLLCELKYPESTWPELLSEMNATENS